MPSDQPPAHASATPDPSPRTRVIVCIDGAAIAWAAYDDPRIDLIVVDEDMPTSGAVADCYRIAPIPLADIDKGWRVLVEDFLGEPLASGPDGSGIPAPDLENCPACRHCGSTEWRIVERIATVFDCQQRAIRYLGTAERGMTCAACGQPPDDFDAVEEAYLAISPEASLMASAHAVIEAWEGGDLAASVRALSSTLQSLGYRDHMRERRPGDTNAESEQAGQTLIPVVAAQECPPTLQDLLLSVRFLFGVTRLINPYQDELLCVYVMVGGVENIAVTSVTQSVADLLGLPYHPERDALQVTYQVGGVTHRIAEMINAMWEMPGHLRGIDL